VVLDNPALPSRVNAVLFPSERDLGAMQRRAIRVRPESLAEKAVSDFSGL
jgi:hypothetical protein